MASSTANAPSDFVQVVNDVIDISLIDNAVQSLELESAPEGTYTELKWTDACEALRRAYVDRVHPSVCTSSNGEFGIADALRRLTVIRKLLPLSNLIRKHSERSK